MKTEVRFRLVGGANPLILVPAFVNGSGPFEFILDTGAAKSLITPELAQQLGVTANETQDAYGAGGENAGWLSPLAFIIAGVGNDRFQQTDQIFHSVATCP